VSATGPSLLFVVSSLHVGGAEKHTISLLNGLDTDQFPLRLCYLKRDESLLAQLAVERLRGVFCCDVKHGVEWGAVRRLSNYIDTNKIDILVCANQYSMLYGFLARFLARRPVKLVEVFHTTALHTFKDELQMLFYRPVFSQCDLLVYVCANQRSYWRQKWLRARKDIVIHNGIDTDYFADKYTPGEKARLRAELGFQVDEYVVGICSALRPEKAHGDYLEAIARLRATGVAVRGLIIGDGPERSAIEAKIRELGLVGVVVITGFKADVRPYIACCNVMTLVSHAIETFSLAALESMSLAKPLVMTRVGGASEQVSDGENGFLFETGDIEQLVRHLRVLASSAALRSSMGDKAHRMVRRQFGIDTMLSAFSRQLSNLVMAGGSLP
jgi:glycosyltransferase involved in cell wall biosynthesis